LDTFFFGIRPHNTYALQVKKSKLRKYYNSPIAITEITETMHTRTCTILVLIIQFTLIILATCTNEKPAQPSIPNKLQIIPLCQQDKSQSHKDSLKGQAKAQQSSNSYSLSASRFDTAKYWSTNSGTLALSTTTPSLPPAVVRQRHKRNHPYQDYPQ
jgi:hypothetical protein